MVMNGAYVGKTRVGLECNKRGSSLLLHRERYTTQRSRNRDI